MKDGNDNSFLLPSEKVHFYNGQAVKIFLTPKYSRSNAHIIKNKFFLFIKYKKKKIYIIRSKLYV